MRQDVADRDVNDITLVLVESAQDYLHVANAWFFSTCMDIMSGLLGLQGLGARSRFKDLVREQNFLRLRKAQTGLGKAQDNSVKILKTRSS